MIDLAGPALRAKRLWAQHMQEQYRTIDRSVSDICGTIVSLLDQTIAAVEAIEIAKANIKGWAEAIDDDCSRIRKRSDYNAAMMQASHDFELAGAAKRSVEKSEKSKKA